MAVRQEKLSLFSPAGKWYYKDETAAIVKQSETYFISSILSLKNYRR